MFSYRTNSDKQNLKKSLKSDVFLTVVSISRGRRPYESDRAPVTGDARNCSRENSEPIRPVRGGGKEHY